MIFQFTHEWVLDKSPHTGKPKTHTRRIFKPGDYYVAACAWVVNSNQKDHRPRYKEKAVVAVQPGRGVKAAGHVRIAEIAMYPQDVRGISTAQARDEGFADEIQFLNAWMRMHDPNKQFYFADDGLFHYWANRWDKWVAVSATAFWGMLLNRPDDRYQAWDLALGEVSP